MIIQLRHSVSTLALLLAGATFTLANDFLLEEPGLVSTGWLAENIDSPQLRLIDARPSLGSYLEGHLPGAIYLNTETFRITEEGVPATLLAPELIGGILQKLGIGNQHTVVVYSSGEDSFAHATYVAYVLEWLGHQAIGVLDGGVEKWVEEGRMMTPDFPSHPAAHWESGIPKISLYKTTREVMHAAFRERAVILDARDPDAFAAGHIPSAENLDLTQTLAGDEVKTWKSVDDLRALAAAAGADGTRPVITYCTSGRQASQIWFTLRHVAGLENVSSYPGSWIRWTAERQPVHTSQ